MCVYDQVCSLKVEDAMLAISKKYISIQIKLCFGGDGLGGDGFSLSKDTI